MSGNARCILNASSIVNELAAIPFEDHHVHAPFRSTDNLMSQLRATFTESPFEDVWNQRVPQSVAYRWMIRRLAKLLNVAPNEDAVITARRAMGEPAYHAFLADDANLGGSYADDLFAFGRCYDVEEWSSLLGDRSVHRLLRIEVFVEQAAAADAATLEDALQKLTDEIDRHEEHNVVGLKSIAGYRSGLEIVPPTRDGWWRAVQAFNEYRSAIGAVAGGQAARIEDPDLVNLIVWTAVQRAARYALPIQFHVALGDDDIVMTRNDPTLMRALFDEPSFRDVPFVLLHCYPYHRQAGYLASLYANVYVDLGLTIPLVGTGVASVISETLELTPINSLLASSDGHAQPEFQWFAIHLWREALATVFGEMIERDAMDFDDAVSAGQAVLRDNAQQIYPV